HEPSILPGGHAAVVITTATEQKVTRFLARGFDVIVDRLPCLLRQLKPDWPTGLLLPHCRAIDRIPTPCNVLDPESDDIATSWLSSYCPLSITKSRVRPSICNRIRIDPRRCGRSLRLRLHGHPPELVRHYRDAGPAYPLKRAGNVSFRCTPVLPLQGGQA